MKAKLVNGEIQYFKQPDWILGDASQYAIEQGYKEVIYQEGNGGTYETETNIIVETPIPPPLTNEQIATQREQAYKAESDSLYMAFQKYTIQGLTEKAEAKKTEWLGKVAEIDARYPYNL